MTRWIVVAALTGAGCGAPLLKLPPGPGAPAADGAAALAEATTACRGITSVTSEIGVSGSAGGRRLRARMIAGLAAPDAALLQAFAFGQPVFTFGAREGMVTLLLTRERRVLRGSEPASVLEALTGVPIDPAALRSLLIGCPPDATPGSARALGENWRLLTSGDREIYLRRADRTAPWHVAAIVSRAAGGPDWRAEFHDFRMQLPQTIRLLSTERDRFDLRLALADVELDTPIPAAAFEVRVPEGTGPITIEELRQIGPLGSDGP